MYKPEICENVLLFFNVTCYIVEDLLQTVPSMLKLEKFQSQGFILLFSTFDDVLLLDADNIAHRPPEDFMNVEPYTSKGLVTWPDYV